LRGVYSAVLWVTARILVQLILYTNGKDFLWHTTFSLVPTHDAVTGRPITTFAICQELVDALPVHSFQKIEGGMWRETLIDVAVRNKLVASGGIRGCVVVHQHANANAIDANPAALPNPLFLK
jgi:SAM-dependent MidA family methyltransferase